MIVKQIYKTDNKSHLLIKIPKNFRGKSHILVVLDDSIESKTDKMYLMELASKDPLFMSDIDAISKDFRNIDAELL